MEAGMTLTRPDVDLTDGDFYADRPAAHEAYRWMRANEPVFRDRNGLTAAATYAAVIEAERNPELFSNAGGIRPDQGPLPMMIDMDDPAHLLRRKLVNAGFTRKRLKVQDASIGALCDRLLDAVCERGECDLVRDIAAPLPMAVIGDMLGVLPDERELFLKWSDEMMVGLSSTVSEADIQVTMDAFVAYNDYTRRKIDERRAAPTEDLISVLVHSEVDGERLSDDDILQETLLILVGGDETTRHTISGGIEQLIRDREQWDQLRNNPDLLPGAVEEMLRWTSPLKNMARTVTADTDFHGTGLKQGEKMILLFESANFDETVFDHPDNFRIQRDPNSHLTFGFGTHFCLGNQLARIELINITRRVLQRLPDLRLPEGADLPLRPANFVSGLEQMPVKFTPTKPLNI
jgi:cytochrome P450 family 142 subfamily A polypeptide 1